MFECRNHTGVFTISEQAECLLAKPFVGMVQNGDQFPGRFLTEVEGSQRFRIFRSEPIDAAIVFFDLAGIVLTVGNLMFVHVTEINRAVGTEFNIDGSKAFVGGGDGALQVFCLIGRSIAGDLTFDDTALQRFDSKQVSPVFFR